jgi:hypothetical protein
VVFVHGEVVGGTGLEPVPLPCESEIMRFAIKRLRRKRFDYKQLVSRVVLVGPAETGPHCPKIVPGIEAAGGRCSAGVNITACKKDRKNKLDSALRHRFETAVGLRP